MIMRRTALNLALAGYAVLLGCEQPTVGFYETKTIEERLTNADITAVVAVLEAVGEKSPAELPFPFLPPPVWSESRTLPVSELLAAEEDALQSVWSPGDSEQMADSVRPVCRSLGTRYVGSKSLCGSQIDVCDFAWRSGRLDMQQNPNATWHGSRDGDLAGAEQRHVRHAQGSGGFGGKGARQIGRRGEDRRDDIIEIVDAVAVEDRAQQFLRGCQDLIGIVRIDRRRAADAAYRHANSPETGANSVSPALSLPTPVAFASENRRARRGVVTGG